MLVTKICHIPFSNYNLFFTTYFYSFIVHTDRTRNRKSTSYREAWSRLECWVSRACAARSTLGELEAALERLLQQRERARNTDQDPDAKHLLRYLRDSIADTQAQIMQIEVI